MTERRIIEPGSKEEAALFHGRLPEWDEPARLTPEGVRALIAEAGALTKVRFGGDSDLVRRLAAALSASLSRTLETAEEWEYGICYPEGDDYWPEEPVDVVKTLLTDDGGKLCRRRKAGHPEPVPPTPETGDPLSCADLGHEGPGQCGHPDHAPTPEEADRA